MIPSAQAVQRIASHIKLRPGAIEKALRLLDLLTEINADPTLKGRLALKGGTALNMFHLDMPRLSVDIDLNYVASLNRSQMRRERSLIDDAISKLLVSRGYAIRRVPRAHAGGKWSARFSSALGGNGTLEVDVNYMNREPIFGMRKMDSCKVDGMQAFDILVIDVHEIIAGKLVALVARNTGRDLFDTCSILEMGSLDWSWIRIAVLALGASGRPDWRQVSIGAIERPDESLDKLAYCLKAGYLDDSGGVEAWLTRSLLTIRRQLSSLFDFSAGERLFLDALLDHREVDVRGLDINANVKEKLKAMPMLAWKAQHVRDAQR
ncbi:MAG: nucleotidyl transferase AbiEii/AbiGii toxin family protein [Gammaproteobacteria bacterium]|nr:nucleotidyl transferase AbiEii/AbiGii toxin family protein [Gammaproteobacteria bacterium]